MSASSTRPRALTSADALVPLHEESLDLLFRCRMHVEALRGISELLSAVASGDGGFASIDTARFLHRMWGLVDESAESAERLSDRFDELDGCYQQQVRVLTGNDGEFGCMAVAWSRLTEDQRKQISRQAASLALSNKPPSSTKRARH